MRRILVLRGGALGDFIVTLPALAALRARWPDAHLALAGNATAAALALARGLLDAVHSQQEARWAALFSTAPLPEDFARWLQDFDLVISFWPDPDRDLARRFPLRPQQQFLAGAALPQTTPAARHFTLTLAPLKLPEVPPYVRLRPLSVVAGLEEVPPRTVIIHPGSGSPRKNWPMARWRDLAEWLIQEHAVTLEIVSGPAEDPALLPEMGTPLRDRSLEVLVGHLDRCVLFIGHDSGISHLAAACGARCVLLFGPTDAQIWAPPTPTVTVVTQDPALPALELQRVQQAVSEALS